MSYGRETAVALASKKVMARVVDKINIEKNTDVGR